MVSSALSLTVLNLKTVKQLMFPMVAAALNVLKLQQPVNQKEYHPLTKKMAAFQTMDYRSLTGKYSNLVLVEHVDVRRR